MHFLYPLKKIYGFFVASILREFQIWEPRYLKLLWWALGINSLLDVEDLKEWVLFQLEHFFQILGAWLFNDL